MTSLSLSKAGTNRQQISLRASLTCSQRNINSILVYFKNRKDKMNDFTNSLVSQFPNLSHIEKIADFNIYKWKKTEFKIYLVINSITFYKLENNAI